MAKFLVCHLGIFVSLSWMSRYLPLWRNFRPPSLGKVNSGFFLAGPGAPLPTGDNLLILNFRYPRSPSSPSENGSTPKRPTKIKFDPGIDFPRGAGLSFFLRKGRRFFQDFGKKSGRLQGISSSRSPRSKNLNLQSQDYIEISGG